MLAHKNLKIQLGSFPAVKREKYLPYSSGVLESYIKKDPNFSHVHFETPLYDYGQDPTSNLDILGLTVYVWSQDYCDKLAQEYKEKNPNSFVIFGGPNVPVDSDQQTAYEKKRPFVDIFVAGAGEEIFKEILTNFPDCNKWYRLNKSNKYKFDTPTVYIDGTFDKFLHIDEKFSATIETTRGCPFKCSFCDWGDATGSAVTKYDNDINYKTIDKIFSADNISGIRIIDANWGMYERDLEMTKYMAARKKDDFYITFCGIAKNSIKYTREIAKIFYENKFLSDLNNAQPLKIGVQSWHPTTLKYTERDNIKEESFLKMLEYYKEHNIPYISELICGLPGETPKTWLYTLQKDFEYGVAFQNIYNLEIVANMPMLLKFRDEFEMEIKKVYFPKDLTEKCNPAFYHKNRKYVEKNSESLDYDKDFFTKELLVSCFSYSTEDLLQMYDYSWWMNTLYSTGIIGQIDSVEESILDFYENLDKKPFWKQLVTQHRSCWKEAFIDGVVTSAAGIRYWMHTLNRSDELIQIADNFEQAQDELGCKLNTFQRSLKLYNYGYTLKNI